MWSISLFRNYYTVDQIKLVKAHYCNKHLLCPMCAGVRAARSMKRYLERIQELMRLNPRLKPVLITLTVKNGENLEERFEHLVRSFRKLLDRYRDYKKKGWGFNQFCKIDGAFYTTEYTYNETTKQWHPHIHIFALLTDWIDQEELAETWHDITLDSYIVDVRRVKKQKNTDTARQLQRYVNTLLNSAIYQWKIPSCFPDFERKKAHWVFRFYAWFEN